MRVKDVFQNGTENIKKGINLRKGIKTTMEKISNFLERH